MRRRELGNIFLVKDNTGVLSGKIIAILSRKYINIGDICLIAIKQKFKVKKTIKKKLLYALVLQTKQKLYRKAGDYYVQFPKRAIVLLNNDHDNFLGTKIFSPLIIELFKKPNNPVEPVLRYFRSVI